MNITNLVLQDTVEGFLEETEAARQATPGAFLEVSLLVTLVYDPVMKLKPLLGIQHSRYFFLLAFNRHLYRTYNGLSCTIFRFLLRLVFGECRLILLCPSKLCHSWRHAVQIKVFSTFRLALSFSFNKWLRCRGSQGIPPWDCLKCASYALCIVDCIRKWTSHCRYDYDCTTRNLSCLYRKEQTVLSTAPDFAKTRVNNIVFVCEARILYYLERLKPRMVASSDRIMLLSEMCFCFLFPCWAYTFQEDPDVRRKCSKKIFFYSCSVR